jgi:ParB family chromosome partitioning protein
VKWRNTVKVPINEIHVRERLRAHIGDIEPLKASIQKVGLLNPILINHSKELISGNRRLEACRQLGWTEIEVTHIDTGKNRVKELDLEYHENLGRLNLVEDEERAYDRHRNSLLHPPVRRSRIGGWLHRLWELIKKLLTRNKNG